MKGLDKSAVVITDGDLIFDYIDFYVDDGFLVKFDGKSYLLTDGRYIEHARLYAKAECYLQSDMPIEKLLSDLGVKRVGLIYNYTSASLYSRLISLGYETFDYTEDYNEYSSVKTSDKLLKIQKACEITEKAFEQTLPSIKEGITELELSAILEYNFKRLGGLVGFETIVAFGKGSSVPHYKTGDKKLEKNMPILMDFGCSYQGYLSDMTRTLFFGEPSYEFLRVYNAVKNAQEFAYKNIRSGMTCRSADYLARNYLKSCGLDKYFSHSLGHGIGVKIHEYPTLNTRSEAVLKDGMVFSIEPGVYLENEFGIRIEDTVVLQDGKCKSFMKSSKDPIIISVK